MRDFSRESIIRTCARTRAARASLIKVSLSAGESGRGICVRRSTGGSTWLSAADACATQVSDSLCKTMTKANLWLFRATGEFKQGNFC